MAIVGACVALAATGSGAAALALAADGSPLVPPDEREAQGARTPQGIYRLDAPGVVRITTRQVVGTQVPGFGSPFDPPQNRPQEADALGSGFVIDRQGDIVTNDHVVQGGKDIRVRLSDDRSYPAEIVGEDPSTDLAVVRIDARADDLHPLRLDDSSSLAVGDSVYALGNPFGLDGTFTAGIVSALGRDLQAPDGLTIVDAIQTDAAINHGNSGGPLLDADGHVVGVNAQITGGSVDGNVGVGFAIPSATVSRVAAELLASGHARHPWLGVQVATVDADLAQAVEGLPASGALVTGVAKDGPAARAGLRAGTSEILVDGAPLPVGGDVITSVDGAPVHDASALTHAVATAQPGDRLVLGVTRAGHSRAVTVTLADTPADVA
jgi:S1-C subfamily serine protease